MTTLYQHPDGGSIDIDDLMLTMTDSDDQTVSIPIGEIGLIELAHALLALVDEQEEKLKSERDGAGLASDLLNELMEVRGRPQRESFRAIRNKLYALSKLEHFDNAAGGFAGVIVNLMEIGIANLPRGE